MKVVYLEYLKLFISRIVEVIYDFRGAIIIN